jgi:hypothetical protein
MFYDCPCHFVSFHSQSRIEFTVTLHNAVAKNCYTTTWSATLSEDIDRFQIDWQVIGTLNVLMLMKALTLSIPIFQLCFNEWRYHLQLYWAHSMSIFLQMPKNVSIIVCIVENWGAFIIIHVILDFLHFTTKATPSIRPSKHDIH